MMVLFSVLVYVCGQFVSLFWSCLIILFIGCFLFVLFVICLFHCVFFLRVKDFYADASMCNPTKCFV